MKAALICSTFKVNVMRRGRVAIFAVLAIVGVSWFGLRQYNCQQRNAAFRRQIETIKRDAHAQIKVGTKKPDVVQFFARHNIPFTISEFSISESLASGFTHTSGCAPFGCGSDVAVINVRVKLDEAGTAAEEPTVVGMYTNCL
jgi:hypothetical protein